MAVDDNPQVSMSEQTDKASTKTRKASATKRPPKKARPASKRSSTRARKASAKSKSPKTSSAAPSLAPDPATITFGSNRPIVAPPPPKPANSGLRFAGPSDGVLKSRGPQPTSPKAEGLTFANTKPDESKPATSAGKAGQPLTQKASMAEKASPAQKPSLAEKPSTPHKPSTTKSADKAAKAPQNRDGRQSGKAEDRKAKADAGKPKSEKTKTPSVAKPAGPTKPAIAPQNHGPLIEKEPSRGPWPLALAGLGIAAIGFVWWLDIQNAPAPAPGSSEIAARESTTAPEEPGNAATPSVPPQQQAPAGSQPASEPAPLPDSTLSAAELEFAPPRATVPNAAAPTTQPSLSVAEIREVQDLLQVLGLDTGAGDGEMSEATKAAIRDYQTMAGLPIDGKASPALLEELRSVASLYGGN